MARDVKNRHSLPKIPKFQSIDSWVHNEIRGCSHFLPLFGNELIGPGGCEPSAAVLYRRKCFWSLIGTGCCLATALYLTGSTNVKMFPRVYKTQLLGPSVCLCPVFTWWQRDASTPFNAVYFKCELMYWTHLTGSLSLDESPLCLQPPLPSVTSRSCRIWPLPPFPAQVMLLVRS